MKNNIFRKIGHSIALPFVALSILIKVKSSKSKANRYELNPEDFDKIPRYDVVYKLCKKALFFFNVDLEVRGLKNLIQRPMFIVPNHKSNLDPIIMIKILYELKGYPFFNFVAKKECLDDKWISGCVRLIDSIFIDRNNLRDAIRVINDEIKLLKENTVCCFLEGSRIEGDEIGEFKSAGLEPAYKTLVPIVPVVIYGTDKALSDNDEHKLKYKKVVVEFLEPIKHNQYINESKEYFAEKLHSKISKKYNEIKDELSLKKDN